VQPDGLLARMPGFAAGADELADERPRRNGAHAARESLAVCSRASG